MYEPGQRFGEGGRVALHALYPVHPHHAAKARVRQPEARFALGRLEKHAMDLASGLEQPESQIPHLQRRHQVWSRTTPFAPGTSAVSGEHSPVVLLQLGVYRYMTVALHLTVSSGCQSTRQSGVLK